MPIMGIIRLLTVEVTKSLAAPPIINAIAKEITFCSFKKSKKGLLGLYVENGKMVTKATDYATMESIENLLQPILKNGEFLSMSTLDDIRNRLGGV